MHEFTILRSESPKSKGRATTAAAGLALTSALIAGCSGSTKPAAHEAPLENPTPPATSLQPVTPTPEDTPSVSPKILVPGSGYRETQQFGADSFANITNASGYGDYIEKGAVVTVDCLATGPVEAAPSARGKWYHITSPAQLAGYYAAANTFENGSTEGPISSQPEVDPNVPACPPMPTVIPR